MREGHKRSTRTPLPVEGRLPDRRGSRSVRRVGAKHSTARKKWSWVLVIGCLAFLGLALYLPGCGTAGSVDSSMAGDTLAKTTTTMDTQEVVDLFPAPVGEKWGFIDRTGRLVVEPQYHWALPFHEGLACVDQGNSDEGPHYGFVDTTGSHVIPARLSYPSQFGEGLAPMSDGNGWGYINKTGEYALPPEYEGTGLFSEGLASVETRDGLGYIDKTGRFVIEPQSEYLSAFAFSEGLAAVGTSQGRGYIDKTGRFIIEPLFLDVGEFRDGLAPVCREVPEAEDGWFQEWGYIDRTGQLVIPYQFMQAMRFGSGLAPVLVAPDASRDDEGGWYYIDTDGSVVLGPFEWADSFHDGLAIVGTRDGQNAYIDTSGNIVWSAPNAWLQENGSLD